MQRLEPKHPRPIRWTHWINAPVLFGMIYSGLLIYWANDVYRIGIGSWTLIKLFPDWFYRLLNLEHRLSEGMAWHFLLAWLLAINGLFYVVYTIVSGERRHLVPTRRSLREAWMTILHDLHSQPGRAAATEIQRRLQQFAYTGIILMGAGSLITGLAIYKPTQLAWLVALSGGYEWARWIHFWLTMGYVAFFIVHISQVIRAGWNNFRAMVTGYEVISAPPKEVSHEPTATNPAA